MGRRLALATLLCAVWALGTPGIVWAGTDSEAAGDTDSAAAAKRRAAVPEYRVGPGDVLDISVWREEGLQKQVLVRPDGGISFPLAGIIYVNGKSLPEVQREIVSRLGRLIPSPEVSVSIVNAVSNRVYVIGKVNKPGEFVAPGYMDVMQALAMAGGLNPFAREDAIKILRRIGTETIVLPFDYEAILKGRKLELNVILKGGDVVVVP